MSKLNLVLAASLAFSLAGCAPAFVGEDPSGTVPEATAGSAPAPSTGWPAAPETEVADLNYGIPTGWMEYEQDGLHFALPAEFTPNADVVTENETLIADYTSEALATPSLRSHVQVMSWVDKTNAQPTLNEFGEGWRAIAVPGPGFKAVGIQDQPHTAENGDVEMFKVINFQMWQTNSNSYQVQLWLPIDDTNEPMLRDVAGTLRID
jgi:hypothetical protein